MPPRRGYNKQNKAAAEAAATKKIPVDQQPPNHPQENFPSHVTFLARSLRRNDVDMAALMDLNRSLKLVKANLIQHCGEELLLDIGEGLVQLTPDQQNVMVSPALLLESSGSSGESKLQRREQHAALSKKLDSVLDTTAKRKLCVDFLLRMILRRRLLNRLSRRLLRVAHAMDGEDVTAPMPPKYGDLRFHVDTEQLEAAKLQWQVQKDAEKRIAEYRRQHPESIIPLIKEGQDAAEDVIEEEDEEIKTDNAKPEEVLKSNGETAKPKDNDAVPANDKPKEEEDVEMKDVTKEAVTEKNADSSQEKDADVPVEESKTDGTNPESVAKAGEALNEPLAPVNTSSSSKGSSDAATTLLSIMSSPTKSPKETADPSDETLESAPILPVSSNGKASKTAAVEAVAEDAKPGEETTETEGDKADKNDEGSRMDVDKADLNDDNKPEDKEKSNHSVNVKKETDVGATDSSTEVDKKDEVATEAESKSEEKSPIKTKSAEAEEAKSPALPVSKSSQKEAPAPKPLIEMPPLRLLSQYEKDCEILKEFNDAYEKHMDPMTGEVSFHILEGEQNREEDYVSIGNRGEGVGASNRFMSLKEKEMDFQRWQSAVLACVPEAPTLDEIGMNRVFLIEERRKRIRLKKEEEEREAKRQKLSSPSKKEELAKKRNVGAVEKKSSSKKSKEEEEEMLRSTKIMKTLPLVPFPSFHASDLIRIRKVHFDLMSHSIRRGAQKRVQLATDDYNSSLKTSTTFFEHKHKLELQMQELANHYRGQLNKVKQEWYAQVQIEMRHWRQQKAEYDANRIKKLMPSSWNTTPQGTRITKTVVQRYKEGSIPHVVGTCIADIVDAIDIKVHNNVQDEPFPRFKFAPQPTMETFVVDRSTGETMAQHGQRTQRKIQQELQAVEMKLNAAEDERKRAWKKLMKVKAELESIASQNNTMPEYKPPPRGTTNRNLEELVPKGDSNATSDARYAKVVVSRKK